jgi:CRISPR/Cas system-associated exonuclease Cas4 (RecB family)
MLSITKNIFLKTVFCDTLGWRLRNETLRPEISPAQLFRMEQGKKIHKLARELYPDGIFVNEPSSLTAGVRTRDLLAHPETREIFEATFLSGNYIAKADILVRNSETWDLIEIKSSITEKDELIEDLAYTTLVAQAAGVSPSSIHLMLIDKNYRLGMPGGCLFVKKDVTQRVLAKLQQFRTMRDQIDSITSAPAEPEPKLRFNCKKCDYFEECLGESIGTPVFNVPRLKQKSVEELIAEGVISICDVPDDYPLSVSQRQAVECAKSGRVQIDPDLKRKLAGIHWPAFYLDFETMMTALPLWPKVAPYDHIPIQYSLHIRESPGSEISHKEYLADPGQDCRRELAERLIVDCAGDGSIISYSSFEKTTIAGLAKLFPDLSGPLQFLANRIIDLEPCIKCVSHPKFCGRTSIKVILPVLVPDLSYDGLEIANGDEALVTFAKMAQGTMTPVEMERKRAALLEYCERDTLAMVRLHEVLREWIHNFY